MADNSQKPCVDLDEVDKAHDDVCDLLFQILDEGRLTDSRGRAVNFRQSLIIMTCNIDLAQIQATRIGFDPVGPQSEPEYHRITQQKLDRLLQERFRPELLNRVDSRVLFDPLDSSTLKLIAKKNIIQLAEQLAEEGWILSVAPELLDFIMKKSYNPAYGAREISRIVRQEIAQPLAEIILQGNIPPGTILAEIKKDVVNFRRIGLNDRIDSITVK